MTTHRRVETMDTSNIDFGGMDLFSAPVKKLLSSALEESLMSGRRPTIPELKEQGIYVPVSDTELDRINNKSRQGVSPYSTSATPFGQLNQEQIGERLSLGNLETPIDVSESERPNFPSPRKGGHPIHANTPSAKHVVGGSVYNSRTTTPRVRHRRELSAHLNQWLNSRRKTITELEQRGVLPPGYFDRSDDSYVFHDSYEVGVDQMQQQFGTPPNTTMANGGGKGFKPFSQSPASNGISGAPISMEARSDYDDIHSKAVTAPTTRRAADHISDPHSKPTTTRGLTDMMIVDEDQEMDMDGEDDFDDDTMDSKRGHNANLVSMQDVLRQPNRHSQAWAQDVVLLKDQTSVSNDGVLPMNRHVSNAVSEVLSDSSGGSEMEMIENDLYFLHSHHTTQDVRAARIQQSFDTGARHSTSDSVDDNELPSQSDIDCTTTQQSMMSSPQRQQMSSNSQQQSSPNLPPSYHMSPAYYNGMAQMITPNGVSKMHFPDNVRAAAVDYYSIPVNVEGGLLSTWTFLPYRQWCEDAIVKQTESANELIDQLKQEVTRLGSETPHIENTDDMYDDIEMKHSEDLGARAPPNTTTTERMLWKQRSGDQLNRISGIDEQLAVNRDKIHTMFKIRTHITSIQAQYDTFMDQLREGQQEVLDMLKELEEQHTRCKSTLQCLRENEVWLITNIANTIAERSEKIERMNKHIRKCLESEKQSAEAELVNTREFVDQLHAVIIQLQEISDDKHKETTALQSNISVLCQENGRLCQASANASHICISKLTDLQKHYKIPTFNTTQSDSYCRSLSISHSLQSYTERVNAIDYYPRAIELHNAARIYSDADTKLFFNEFVSLCIQIIIDAQTVSEYIQSKLNYSVLNTSTQDTITALRQPTSDSLYDEDYADDGYNTANRLRRTQSTEHTESVLDQALQPIALSINHSNLAKTSQLKQKFTAVSSKNVIGNEHIDIGSSFGTKRSPLQILEHFLSASNLHSAVSSFDDSGANGAAWNAANPELSQCPPSQWLGLQLIRQMSEVFCRDISHNNYAIAPNANANAKANGTEAISEEKELEYDEETKNGPIISAIAAAQQRINGGRPPQHNRNTSIDRQRCHGLSGICEKEGASQELFNRIEIIAKWGDSIPHIERVLSCVAQHVTLAYKHDILDRSVDKIKESARNHCLILMTTALCTSSDRHGIVELMKQIDTTNVYRNAAKILFTVYDIAAYS